MTSPSPYIEFFDGIYEDLSNVSLRRDRNTGMRIVVLMFNQLKSIEQFNSYRRRFANALRLTDSEGAINITPSSVQFVFGGVEGDELQRVECKLELDQEAHLERLIGFCSVMPRPMAWNMENGLAALTEV